MAKRLRAGDVLEVRMQGGFGYLLYIGRHAEYGDAVSVCPAVMTQHVSVMDALFEEGYVTFYPAHAAVAQGLATVAGRLRAPPMPRVFRRPGVRSGHRIETWIIQDESSETVKTSLTESERRLPVAAIWNHEYLLQRIAEGWRPEWET